MAPTILEECAEAETLDVEALPRQERRVHPLDSPASAAWVEYEELQEFVPTRKSPNKNRRQKRYPEVYRSADIKNHQRKSLQSDYQKQVKGRTSKGGRRREKIKRKGLAELLQPPYFILTMIAINVGVYALGGSKLLVWLEWSPGSWLRHPWRLLSYGLVHASAAHLALNCLMALAVGWRLEREQGSFGTACIWWGGVAGGALGAAALQPEVSVVGSSAAIYAMLTAHVPNLCLRIGYIPLWWFRPLSIVLLASSEACWSLLRSQIEPPIALSSPTHRGTLSRPMAVLERDHVAWAAHAFGAAFGLPIGFVFFTGENSSKVYIMVCKVVSVTILTTVAMLTSGYYAYRSVAPRDTFGGI